MVKEFKFLLFNTCRDFEIMISPGVGGQAALSWKGPWHLHVSSLWRTCKHSFWSRIDLNPTHLPKLLVRYMSCLSIWEHLCQWTNSSVNHPLLAWEAVNRLIMRSYIQFNHLFHHVSLPLGLTLVIFHSCQLIRYFTLENRQTSSYVKMKNCY